MQCKLIPCTLYAVPLTTLSPVSDVRGTAYNLHGISLHCIVLAPPCAPMGSMFSMEQLQIANCNLQYNAYWYFTLHTPVCTPMGSTFSMEQMMTTLSLRSRITSSSNSFHPMSEISTSTCACVRSGMPACFRPSPAPPRVMN